MLLSISERQRHTGTVAEKGIAMHAADGVFEGRSDGGLAELLEAESRFAASLDAARSEASAIIRDATRGAEQEEAASVLRLEAESGRLRFEIAEETETRITAMQARLDSLLERLARFDPSAREDLVASLLQMVLMGRTASRQDRQAP